MLLFIQSEKLRVLLRDTATARTPGAPMDEKEDEPRIDVEKLPPRLVTTNERRVRWVSTGRKEPISPFQVIDGKIVRSALLINRTKKPRSVVFRTNKNAPEPENQVVAGYLEPENPWKFRDNLKIEDLMVSYKRTCKQHHAEPLKNIIAQLQHIPNFDERCELLDFKGETLQENDVEPLEEIFRRVLFEKIDLNGALAVDRSAEVIFEILGYYLSCTHLDISNNPRIGVRGWQAFAKLIKQSPCMKRVEAKNLFMTEEYMIIFSRAVRYSYLSVLRIETCALSGKLMALLALALKFNVVLRDLYLLDCHLDIPDSVHLGAILRFNNRLDLLDLSNNNLQDEGICNVINGLTHQLNYGAKKSGLASLVIWNNHLTRRACSHINVAIAESKSLKYLNLGSNSLTDDLFLAIRDSLSKNEILQELNLKHTELTDFGASEIAYVLKTNNALQMLDLRDNLISMNGIIDLAEAMEKNKCIIELNFDTKPPDTKIKKKVREYKDIIKTIQKRCEENYEASLKVDEEEEETDEDEVVEKNSKLVKSENGELATEELEVLIVEEPQEELPSQYRRYMNWKI